MNRWTLAVTCDAENEVEAITKLVDKLPYMLVNGVNEDGSITLELREDGES